MVARTNRIEPPMITGIRMRPMMKPLLRTSVANSDCATMIALRNVRLLCLAVLQGFAMRTKMSCSDGLVTSK